MGVVISSSFLRSSTFLPLIVSLLRILYLEAYSYLAYPFQNQEVNSYTGNLYATYCFINCKEKEPVEPSLAFFFGTDMLSSQHSMVGAHTQNGPC